MVDTTHAEATVKLTTHARRAVKILLPAHCRRCLATVNSRVVRCAVFVWLFLLPLHIEASEKSNVALRVQPAGCTELPYDPSALQYALEIELRATNVLAALAHGSPDISLTLPNCSVDETHLAVDITLPPGAAVAHLRADLSLADMAQETRERTLAVAIVEFLNGAVPTGASQAEDRASAPKASPTRGLSERSSPSALGRKQILIASYEAYVSSQEFHAANRFLGGGLALQIAHIPSGRALRLSADGETGATETPWGTVNVRTLGMGLYATQQFSKEPRLTLGPGVRLVAAQAEADTRGGGKGQVRYVFASAVGALVGLAAPLWGAFRLKTTFELSYFVREGTFLAGGRPVVGFSGIHTAGTLGIAYGE
ncbi:MAG: hypothetical protein SFV15_15905 [Polyangiaceae bacterium]|nr:hypothetical protein [Polyangiaceae bacterium]